MQATLDTQSVVWVDVLHARAYNLHTLSVRHSRVFSKGPVLVPHWRLECSMRTPHNSITHTSQVCKTSRARSNTSGYTYHTHDGGTFHFHDSSSGVALETRPVRVHVTKPANQANDVAFHFHLNCFTNLFSILCGCVSVSSRRSASSRDRPASQR